MVVFKVCCVCLFWEAGAAIVETRTIYDTSPSVTNAETNGEARSSTSLESEIEPPKTAYAKRRTPVHVAWTTSSPQERRLNGARLVARTVLYVSWSDTLHALAAWEKLTL